MTSGHRYSQITYSSSCFKKPSLVKIFQEAAGINRELELEAPNADLEEAARETEQVLQRFNPSQLKGKTKARPVMGFEFSHTVRLRRRPKDAKENTSNGFFTDYSISSSQYQPFQKLPHISLSCGTSALSPLLPTLLHVYLFSFLLYSQHSHLPLLSLYIYIYI